MSEPSTDRTTSFPRWVPWGLVGIVLVSIPWYWLRGAVGLLVVGVVAATMSTADSVILSLSSILVQDFYAKSVRRPASEERLLAAGKVMSWVSVLALVGVALIPRLTLFKLIEIKMELLLQVAPAFVLGLRHPRLQARVVLAGMVAGSVVAGIGFVSGIKWLGVHPGTLGCLLNFAICWIGGRLGRPPGDVNVAPTGGCEGRSRHGRRP